MNCCKLYLVPEQVIESWKSNQRKVEVDYQVESHISKLDNHMGDILKEEGSFYAKEKLHAQELGKYLNLRKSPPPTPSKPLSNRNHLINMPKSLMGRASGLLQYLEDDKDVHRRQGRPSGREGASLHSGEKD